ncbi:MAG: ferrous iron transport protein B [Archaeoglobus sp.]|nr:ferrous iron transport protein B [Archaeoglobus sp.]
MLVGSPNVGKSLIFHALTGKYATVSNYPGTTVDITRGKIKGADFSLIDTPGMYSFIAITEEEKVARRILFDRPDLVIHVVDAKNIERMLPFTLQLIEASFNVILVLNAMDEAERLGIEIDAESLEAKLGIPVVKTIATQKKGIDRLRELIKTNKFKNPEKEVIKLNSDFEERIEKVSKLIEKEYPISKRMLSILALAGDSDTIEMLRNESNFDEIKRLLETGVKSYEIFKKIQDQANEYLEGIVKRREYERGGLRERITELSINPYFSFPMALLSLYMIYLFAGVLGAQILVDLIETAYEDYINVPLNNFLTAYVENYWLRELIGGEYGVVTLGIRYAVAIIFPIVTTFFIAFSILEDSGYLPRLAALLDTAFKKIGLSGRAVIPLLLGLGCGTMATIVTRTLETRKERVIATLMLAVGIPCSAQLGVMMGIAPDFLALLMWISIISVVMLAVGKAASKTLKGEASLFFIELPPLRVPNLSNVVFKTVTRLEWYFKEVMPIFVLVSVVIWIGRLTKVFDLVVDALAYPSQLIGLPKEAGLILLYGFFRRDYGAAGLFDLAAKGLMSYSQIIVAMVTLTLFVPCVAQFGVMCKERGLKTGLAIFFIAISIAFSVGYLTNVLLNFMYR